ncbi:MAG: HvfC/BufC family peptide modification chaperone [Caldimonas sp.]
MSSVELPAATSLDAFQRDFAAALLAEPAEAGAIAAQPGFAVYRNTVLRGCTDALAANYPTVAQLLGAEAFEGAARSFVVSHLPREGGLAGYGEGFAVFLATFEPFRDLTYLADVARLDRAWTEAHLAADAPVLAAAALAGLSPQTLVDAVLVPHPAARWLTFAAQPAFTIWRRHREALPLDAEIDWRGESALVVRPVDAVAWQALDSAGAEFLGACSRGLGFPAAAALAGAADPATSVEDWLPPLVAAGAFTRLEVPEPRP